MTRQEIIKFYENKIDDIVDENKREELLDKLEEIDDLLFSLDFDIDEELEHQESDYIESEEIYYEYSL